MLVQLPYGVRQVFTPVGGHRVRDIEDLQDGGFYVCGGFENFKKIKYGGETREPWTHGRFVLLLGDLSDSFIKSCAFLIKVVLFYCAV